MFQLLLVLIFVLQFEAGTSQKIFFLYKTPGHDVTLSCCCFDLSCSTIKWFFNKNTYEPLRLAESGQVVTDSARAARLRVDGCSLVINNITAADAGLYYCVTEGPAHIVIYLNVLTISLSPPAVDPKTESEVTLQCSLLRYSGLGPCYYNNILWLNETRSLLLHEDVGYKFQGQMNCVSYLTVRRQSGHNRKYICQLVEGNKVMIEVDYTPVFISGIGRDHTERSESGLAPDQTYIILGVAVLAVVVLLVTTALLIRYKKRHKDAAAHSTDDFEEPAHHHDETYDNVTYITVRHSEQRASPKKEIKEVEEVTYSVVRMTVRTEAEDPSSLYSNTTK